MLIDIKWSENKCVTQKNEDGVLCRCEWTQVVS